MPNRLASATSPYLRSHADNPVDWFEWGPEPFALAAERGVPVLVSIGYSTCHWCHVMARESFSDPLLAAQLNESFVAIKVDREEYPDVDASYLAAASAFTQDLGWPLNIFVTPEGGPFFGGTYWPPEPVLGHPAFRDVLAAVSDAWTNRRDAVLANATGITTALAGYTRAAGGTLPDTYARVGSTDIADGIAGFLRDVMRLPGGAFASAQDSESVVDGVRVEGTYYELSARQRAEQTPPALDAKVLTGWNGLAIEALAKAGYVDDARAAADFLLEHHVRPDRLVRSSIGGVASPAPATLEDYGMLAGGLLALAIATGEVRYAVAARELVDSCMVSTGSTTDLRVPNGPEPLLAKLGLALETDPSEGAYPSGLSAMASAAHTLWLLTSESRYRGAAEDAMTSVAALADERPMSFGAALSVMTALAADPVQLVVVSTGSTSELEQFARAWRRPGAVSTVVTAEQATAFEAAGFDLYAGRTAKDGRATAYACREFVCDLPVHAVVELRLP